VEGLVLAFVAAQAIALAIAIGIALSRGPASVTVSSAST